MVEEEHERRRWHFKKELSLGDLIAVAGAVGSVLWAYNALDARITRLETAISYQKAIDSRQDDDALRYQARFEEAMREINRKLDRLMELRVERERTR
jgi:hypothetical protein